MSSQYRGYRALEENHENPVLQSYPPHHSTTNPSANYARLCMLVMDEGTKAAAGKVLENLPSTQTLEDALQAKVNQMQSLLNRGIINMHQIATLYPESGSSIDTEKIDLTLWVVLLRHTTVNAKSINKKWVEDPQEWHRNFWHDIQRLKKIRNNLAHHGKAGLEVDTFWKMWKDTESVLLRLGVQSETIKGYLDRDIDPERAEKAIHQLQSQFCNDIGAVLTQTKKENRRLKIMLGAISIVIIALVTASVVVPFFVFHQSNSCADNTKTVHTSYAMVSYLTREGWGARKPGKMDPLHTPVEYVIVSHTAQVATPCYTTEDCCSTVRDIQNFNMDQSGFSDIAYNYLIGGSGIVFIGRGPRYVSSAAKGWNKRIISIGSIGLFASKPPTDEALNALNVYLDVLVQERVIVSNYTLYGLCQVRPIFPFSPGAAFMRKLEVKEQFPHWKPDNVTNCAKNTTRLT